MKRSVDLVVEENLEAANKRVAEDDSSSESDSETETSEASEYEDYESDTDDDEDEAEIKFWNWFLPEQDHTTDQDELEEKLDDMFTDEPVPDILSDFDTAHEFFQEHSMAWILKNHPLGKYGFTILGALRHQAAKLSAKEYEPFVERFFLLAE